MIKIEECIKVGKLGKAHGVDGSFNVNFDAGFFDDETPIDYFLILFEGYPVPFFIENITLNGPKSSFIKFDHIHKPEDTSEFVNCDIYITHEQRDSLDIQDTSIDIHGFTIIDKTHGQIGAVEAADMESENPLIQTTYNGLEVLIPFNENIVIDIDPDRQVLITDLPDGLLEIFE